MAALNFPASPTLGQTYTANGKTWQWNGTSWASSNSFPTPTILNDVSTQADGRKSVFYLTQDQTNINTISESKDLEVYINGRRLNPYVTTYTYPWITTFDTLTGFEVVNQPSANNAAVLQGKVVIYDTPFVGDTVSLVMNNTGPAGQKRRYPFTATTIALGE